MTWRAALRRLLDHYLLTGHTAALLLDPLRDPIPPPAPAAGVTRGELTDHASALAWFEAEHTALCAAVRQAAAGGFDAHAWRLAWASVEYLHRGGHWQDLADAQQSADSGAISGRRAVIRRESLVCSRRPVGISFV